MAIIYNLKRSKDVYTLNVSQDTDFVLYSVCGGKETKVEEGDIIAADSFDLTTELDGLYKLVLSATGESDLSVNFTVSYHLQNSLILDIENILNGVTISKACDEAYNVCYGNKEKLFLQYKDIFVKMLTFQSLYFDSIDSALVAVFSNFISTSVLNDRCNFQNSINKILKEECIYGSSQSQTNLMIEYVSLYYYATYFIEKNLATGDAEELEFIEQKFNTETVIPTISENSCIDYTQTETVFDEIINASNTKPTVNSFEITPPNNLVDNLFTYTFDGSEFTSGFADAQGDSPYRVKFSVLPVRGTFKFNGVNVVVGTEYLIANISQLVYEATLNENKAIFDIIAFQVSDDNSNTELFSDMANVTINTSAYVNQPISQLGNLTLNKTNRQNHVFTINDFTTSLVPPYVDPEGDSLDAIRVDSLPASGQLQLSGSPVSATDIIDAADIIAGNFVFVSPNQDASSSVSFNFSARDEGSLQWVSS